MAAPFRAQFHTPAEIDGLGIGGEAIHACISCEIACCSMQGHRRSRIVVA
jgi:hypothetical protein